MGTATEFELEGMRFEVRRLSPDDACFGLEVLGKALGPALTTLLLSKTEPTDPDDAASSGDAEADVDGVGAPQSEAEKIPPGLLASLLQSLLSQASQIAVLVKLFVPRTKFDRGSDGNGRMVDFKPFVDIFEGRLDLMVAYLFHAVSGEYASFLSGAPALAGLLSPRPAKGSASPAAPTG